MKILKHSSLKHLVFVVSCFLFTSCAKNNGDAIKNPNKEIVEKEIVRKKIPVFIMMPTDNDSENNDSVLSMFVKAGIEDSGNDNIDANICNYKTQEALEICIKQAISKKTKVVVGPLFGKDVTAIRDTASAGGIRLISLSNSASIARDNVFSFGHVPFKQTELVIDYFLEKNYKNFILLLPKNAHVDNIAKVIETKVVSKGGTVNFVEKYDNNVDSMKKAVLNVANYVEEINESESADTKPLIYVADDLNNADKLLTLLSDLNLDKSAIIFGDNRIDIRNNKANVVFSGFLNNQNTRINEHAKQILNGSSLSYMHKLAYDAGILSAYCIQSDFSETNFFDRINSKAGYKGTSGLVRFVNNAAERKYDIIEKTSGRYKVLQDAGQFLFFEED